MQSTTISPIRKQNRASALQRAAVWSASTGSTQGSQVATDGLDLNTLPTEHGRQRLSRLSDLSGRLMGESTAQHHHQEEPNTASTVNQLSPQELDRERRRYSHIYQSLRTGQPQTFRNGKGQQVAFAVTQNRDRGDYRNYTLQVGRNQVEVNLANRVDEATALGRISDFYSQQPEQLRGALDTIKIEMGANPRNEFWEEKYDMPGFRSAAVGGGGTITVFGGLPQLTERTFHHEFGHNVGFAVREAQDRESRRAGTLAADMAEDLVTGDGASPNVPRGFSLASKADGRSISGYGDRAIAEDFAEFYEEYVISAKGGGGALRQLRSRYPNRFALLQQQVLSRGFGN